MRRRRSIATVWAGEQILLSHSLSYPANISKSENQLYEQKFLISGTKISKILLFAKNILSLQSSRGKQKDILTVPKSPGSMFPTQDPGHFFLWDERNFARHIKISHREQEDYAGSIVGLCY